MNVPMTPPIRLDAISKCYRIFQNPQDRVKQALVDRFQGVLGRKNASPLYREHWALRDVSFELQAGEAVGILGRNGAGKSTLLQIIAGTLEPTAGTVQTKGRITALLELGSGFNPEFTGRENVILNAQILGLSREDALSRFDDIAAFADIGDFIDQPVKTYSSGMMMRLAFAVQTAVDPMVLIIDEALSVGDMFFQAKCMNRINKLLDSGVALLFVSHDIGVVRQICKRAILFEAGKIRSVGGTHSVTDAYTKLVLEGYNALASAQKIHGDDGLNYGTVGITEKSKNIQPNFDQTGTNTSLMIGYEDFEKISAFNRTGNFDAKILNVQVLKCGSPAIHFDFDDEVVIKVIIHFLKDLENLNLGIQFRTPIGTNVCFFDTRLQGEFGRRYEGGQTYVFSWGLNLRLQHGNYLLSCGMSHPPIGDGCDWRFVDVVSAAYQFSVAPRSGGMIDGFFAPKAKLLITAVEPALL